MEKLILKLKEHNISVKLVEGDLVLAVPDEGDFRALLEEIHANKQELISLMTQLGIKTGFQPIEPSRQRDHYPLSSAQKRQYFLHEFDRTSLAYNMPQVAKLEGSLNLDRLKQSFQRIIERHESLRTCFTMIDEHPVQKIVDAAHLLEIEYYEATANEIPVLVQQFIRPFDLSRPPLIRVGLIKLGPTTHILLMDIHHIVNDGVSQGILISDFCSIYNGDALGSLKLQYKDYAVWQQSGTRQRQVAAAKEFWRKEFETEVASLELPIDYPRPLFRDNQGDTIEFRLSIEETAKLRQLAQAEGATLFMVLLSAFNILLAKVGGQDDVVVGVPISGRDHADLQSMVGMFVNTLVVRGNPQARLSLKQFLAGMKQKTLACFANQMYQFEDIIDDLKLTRETSLNPLFDVLFSHQNYDENNVKLSGLTYDLLDTGQKFAKFDLALGVTELRTELVLSVNYATQLFKRKTIERLVAYFNRIIGAMVENPDVLIGNIDILSHEEKHQILETFNPQAKPYAEFSTVIDLFESQALKTPSKVAVRFSEHSLSYQALQERSDRIASFLCKEKLVKPGALIGLMMDRNEYLIPCIFGIMKAGAAYVPIDPRNPVERINTIVQDATIHLVITTVAYADRCAALPSAMVDVEVMMDSIHQQATLALPALSANTLAYVIYTSGSTGKPKGVMVEHRSLVNVIRHLHDQYPVTQHDVYLLKTSTSFDVSLAEIFGWISGGGSLSVLPPNDEGNPEAILRAIESEQVTHINFVPSMFAAFLDELFSRGVEQVKSLKYIFLAGEALPAEMACRFRSLRLLTSLENLYGPTEGTIYNCGFSVADEKVKGPIPIGAPFANTRLYILGQGNSLQPIGVAGELCISGAGVARGYLNNPELTSEKFIASPFSPSETLYRTGDLARWRPDGNIEYLGRLDDQVKLRGFRIELGEIERQLGNHPYVKACAVVIKEIGGEKQLVASCVTEAAVAPASLRKHLMDVLPGYMVPTHFVSLEKMPLSSNGKLNKKALPEPSIAEGPCLPPAGAIEEALLKIWSDVLKVPQNTISVDAIFFEIGGHSLRALVLANKIQNQLGFTMPLRELFENPTIRRQAELISAQRLAASTRNGSDEGDDLVEITI